MNRAPDVNVLYIPVNARCEQLGRAWVRSKEDWLRLAGVQALGPFKSAVNTAILKGMLNDPSSLIVLLDDQKERVYPVREAAYEILQQWQVSVAKPVLRQPLKG